MRGRTFIETYRVADRSWELETDSGELLQAARASLPGGLAEPGFPPNFRLDISVSDAPGTGAWSRPVCRGRDHLALCCIGDESAILFDFRRRVAIGSVTRSVAADSKCWREIVFPFALGVMSPLLGAVPLHAACIRYRNQGVLIGARSGAGKSTLAATLARRGIEFISDDWVYLTRDHGLRVHALPIPLKLLPDARSFFPELLSMVPVESSNGEWSIEFDPAETFGAQRGYSCEPRVVILFDRVPGAELHVRQARTEDLLDWFSEPLDCVPTCLDVQRREQMALIAALRSCRCYVVTCDGTPTEIADNLLRVCDGNVRVNETDSRARSSGVEHLDLLRRGVPAPHVRTGDIGGIAALIRTNHPEVLGHFPAAAHKLPEFEVTAIVESEPWPGSPALSTYQHESLGYVSLGRDGLIACDFEHRESVAFVSEGAVQTGRLYHELRRLLGSFVHIAAITT